MDYRKRDLDKLGQAGMVFRDLDETAQGTVEAAEERA